MPDRMGVIIRTAAREKSVYHFEREISYLVKKWQDIEKRISKSKVGEILYNDNDIVIKILRDILTNDIDEIIVDNEEVYLEIIDYINAFSEGKAKTKVKLFFGEQEIFEEYYIDKEIEKALQKEVWLDCGGYLVIEKTEALISIDINTGRNTGSYNLEKTVLNTNLEAAKEIPKQLRIRNLSGIIIIDFIDMKFQEDKDLVFKQLDLELKKDRLKNNIVHFTDLGLIEMTRKRVGRNLSYFYQVDCPSCNGTGKVKSAEGIIETIIKELKEVSKERDIKIICLISNKEVIEKIKEVYYDILKDHFQRKGKTLKVLIEDINNKVGYDILLEK